MKLVLIFALCLVFAMVDISESRNKKKDCKLCCEDRKEHSKACYWCKREATKEKRENWAKKYCVRPDNLG